MRTLSISMLPLAMLACAVNAQQIVVPYGTTWGTTFSATGFSPWTSSTAIWSTGAYFHRQYFYEASNFTNPAYGITGPILITGVSFRPEDGQPDPGGHSWPAVTIRLGEAPIGMTQGTMTNTFASNFGGSVGLPEALTPVLNGPAFGTVPNTYSINLPLTTGVFSYDPTSGNALVIDIESTAAAAGPFSLTGFASVSLPTTYFARSLSTTTVASATGTLSTTAPAIRLDFIGPGGHGTALPATNADLGGGCGGNARTFYQSFGPGELFDLANTSLLLTPDNPLAPTNYVVTAGATAPDVTKIAGAANIGDLSLTTHAMGWTFLYPSGSTSTIKGCTNGFAWLSATPTATNDLSSTAALLSTSGNLARMCPAWCDWHCGRNTGVNPACGMYHFTDTTGGPGNNVTYVTWWDIGMFNQNTGTTHGITSSTFQLVLRENGMTAEFRYGQMQNLSGQIITGFSPGFTGGTASVDPGSIDISGEVPFATNGPDGAPNMRLVQLGTTGPQLSGRAHLGNVISCSVSNVPATHVLGSFFTDFSVNAPGLPAIPFLQPGCRYNLPGVSSLYPLAFGTPIGSPLPSTTTSGTLTIPTSAVFCGVPLYTQFASWDAGFPFNGTVSNVVAATLGYN